MPGLVERYQRRTVRLGEQVRWVVRELAGRASARLLPAIRASHPADPQPHQHPATIDRHIRRDPLMKA
ncbi:hypothetical protein [Alloactinosynnema sp. L-07]|nr:hypothetical protein [Alloactinosynnema sp. L-07]